MEARIINKALIKEGYIMNNINGDKITAYAIIDAETGKYVDSQDECSEDFHDGAILFATEEESNRYIFDNYTDADGNSWAVSIGETGASAAKLLAYQQSLSRSGS